MFPKLTFLLFCSGILGVRIVVDLKLKCGLSQISDFKGHLYIVEQDSATLSDYISDRINFATPDSSTAFEQTITSEDTDDGWLDNTMEPALRFQHNCLVKEEWKHVEWIGLPYCDDIKNRKVCEYIVEVTFGSERRIQIHQTSRRE